MKLAVTEEGMPSIQVDGTAYPLFMSVMGFQRWAEFKDTDFDSVLGAPVKPLEAGVDGLRMMLRIMFECGEARRAMIVGGSAREIGTELLDKVLALYHPVELASVLLDTWSLSWEEDDELPPPPQTENPSA